MPLSGTILVIDDEACLRTILRELLEKLGLRVLEAPNGEDGLRRCAQDQPDLVLLDVLMSGLNGFEVCARLKENAATREIPVIFLSGLMDPQERVKAFRAGAVDYVSKPFNSEEVGARVGTHLALRAQQRSLEERNEELHQTLARLELLNRKLIDMNEKLWESEAMKSRFLDHMRNEFNNPLSVIMALSSQMKTGEHDPEQRRAFAELILSEASDLDFHLRNVFCASDLEGGEAASHVSRVDVASVLRDAAASFEHAIRGKGIRLEESGAAPEDLVIWADADKLRLVVANLLSNAIKFNREGGRVWLSASIREDVFVLDVEDEGGGIPVEERARIFETFRQLDSGTTRKFQGQGLGLAVTKALVDLMGGMVTVSEGHVQGALFRCVLPIGSPEQASGASAMDGNLFFFDDAEEL